MGSDISEVVDSFNDSLKTMDQRARAMHGRAYGGALRALKGRLVENLAHDVVQLAWHRADHAKRTLQITRERIPVRTSEFVISSTSSGIRNAPGLTYPAGVDMHIFIEEELIAAVECKSYTETAMLKRVLVDFHLMKTVYPNLFCILFQLESQLGAKTSERGPTPDPVWSDSTRALMSLFSGVDLHIITLLEGERAVRRPIHNFPKLLSHASVEAAVQIFEQAFQP